MEVPGGGSSKCKGPFHTITLNYGYKIDVNGINFRDTKTKEVRTEPQRRWVHEYPHLTRADNPKAASIVKGLSLLSTVTTEEPNIKMKLTEE